MDSGSTALYEARTELSEPKATPRTPGMTHRITARANTPSVHFWPMVQGPSAARCSAMICSAPSMERTSAGNILLRTTAVMTK